MIQTRRGPPLLEPSCALRCSQTERAPMRSLDPIALYGAVLSSLIFAWTLWKDRRRISLEMFASFGTRPEGGDGEGLLIIVRNHSDRSVQICDVGLAWSERDATLRERWTNAWRFQRFFRVGWRLGGFPLAGQGPMPITIEGWQSARIWAAGEKALELRELARSRPVAPWVVDGHWKRRFGRPLRR